jgi:hypothetical protein
MPRSKNMVWELPESPHWQSATLAVLMDIRDELQQLNRVFSCYNFQQIPKKLDAIKRNTARKKRVKKP